MLHSSVKGEIAVLMVTYRFLASGLIVLKPITESLPYDLVVSHEDTFYKIQVKKGQSKGDGRWEIPFRKVSPNGKGVTRYAYTEKMVDIICGVIVETNDIYCFPLNQTNVKTGVIVNPSGKTMTPRHKRLVDSESRRNNIKLGSEIISV